jgi:hypothetical protein
MAHESSSHFGGLYHPFPLNLLIVDLLGLGLPHCQAHPAARKIRKDSLLSWPFSTLGPASHMSETWLWSSRQLIFIMGLLLNLRILKPSKTSIPNLGGAWHSRLLDDIWIPCNECPESMGPLALRLVTTGHDLPCTNGWFFPGDYQEFVVPNSTSFLSSGWWFHSMIWIRGSTCLHWYVFCVFYLDVFFHPWHVFCSRGGSGVILFASTHCSVLFIERLNCCH